MSDQHASPSRRSRLLVVGAVLTGGMALSLVGYEISSRNAYRLLEATLAAELELRVDAMERRFRRAGTANLAPLARFSAAQGGDRRLTFRDLAEVRLSSNDDVVALMWIPRVEPDFLPDHEQSACEDGLVDYRVRGVGNPEDETSGDRFPIFYVEPQDRNAETLGLDLAGLPPVWDAMVRAVENSGTSATRPMLWSDDEGDYLAVLLFRAMIQSRQVDDTPEERREKLVGYTAAVVNIGEMVEDALRPFGSGMDIVVHGDTTGDGSEPVCLYDSTSLRALPMDVGASLPVATEGIELARRELFVPRRHWFAQGIPQEALIDRHKTVFPLATLLTGLLLTGIVSAYLNTVLGRNNKIRRLVVRRTAQLGEANKQLSRERFLLTTLLTQAPDYIYFKDVESRFLRISRTLAKYLKLPDAESATGKSDFDYFDRASAEQYRADEQRIMESGEPVIGKEEQQNTSRGKRIWVSTTKVPLRNEEGEIVGTFGISRDITAHKQVEEELAAAKATAEAANLAKSDFVANMSHEIRTPMNAVIGLTELVLETELSETQHEYLKMVLESSESLLTIINDILDFSKIEAGKLDLDHAPFDLRELVGDTMKSLAFRAHGKGLELACRIPPDVPDQLVGDAGRFRQVIVNLVGNAVKFTERGEVVLTMACEELGDDQALLHLTVVDTGIGIAEEDLPNVFSAFEQVDASSTRRFGGSGLGLTISTRLVGMMDGRLWAESTPGEGSRFHFTARFDLAPAGPPITSAEVVAGARVLVVDDNETNRLILDEMLASWGMKPTSVATAAEAIELTGEAQQRGRPFALLLTDANMPGMDGFDLAERIKSDPKLTSMVVMMLTSGGRPGEVSRCETLDVAAYLLKPVKQSELFDAVVMSLGICQVEDELPEDQAAGTADSLRPLKVLLAEDSLFNQKLAVGLLNKYGHEVVVANHGREVLAALESQQFDLVLMDVQMPEMDGFEATGAIRAKERKTGAHMPIVAMTAHAMKGDRQRCLKAGMDGYVSKPIRAAVLFQTIAEVLLENRTATDEREAGEDATTAEEVVVDWDAVAGATDGDRSLRKDIVELFLDQWQPLLSEVQSAVADGVAEPVAAAAHKLKGAIRFFGSGAVFQLAWQLEKTAREGNLNGAAVLLTRLEDTLTRLAQAIEADADRWRC